MKSNIIFGAFLNMVLISKSIGHHSYIERPVGRSYSITTCDYQTQVGYSCVSCTRALHCYPGNAGLLIDCFGIFRYCRGGRCSRFQGDKCAVDTTPNPSLNDTMAPNDTTANVNATALTEVTTLTAATLFTEATILTAETVNTDAAAQTTATTNSAATSVVTSTMTESATESLSLPIDQEDIMNTTTTDVNSTTFSIVV